MIHAPDPAAGTRLGRQMAETRAWAEETLSQVSVAVVNGGRVLGVTALADTPAAAYARAYEAVDLVQWPEGFCRNDIGWRAVPGWRKLRTR